MANLEIGRARAIRQNFEQKYNTDLKMFRASMIPEPSPDSADYSVWHQAQNYINNVRLQDPRRWDILYRLTHPIDQRVLQLRQQIMKEREHYTLGNRRKIAEFYEEQARGVEIDAFYAQWEEDMKPDRGGFLADGTYVPPVEGADLTERVVLPDYDRIATYRAKRDNYLGALSEKEKKRLDHELG